LKIVAITVLVTALSPLLGAKDSKNQYTLAVEIMETQTAVTDVNGRQVEARCKDNATSVDCTAREHDSGGDSSYSVSVAKASDGNIYRLRCFHSQSMGRRALWVARSDGPGRPPAFACNVPPGTYKARWDKERLKVLLDYGEKPREIAFEVVGSQRMTVKEMDECKACTLAKEQ